MNQKKKLDLDKRTVRSLTVRTGLKTGNGTDEGMSGSGSGGGTRSCWNWSWTNNTNQTGGGVTDDCGDW